MMCNQNPQPPAWYNPLSLGRGILTFAGRGITSLANTAIRTLSSPVLQEGILGLAVTGASIYITGGSFSARAPQLVLGFFVPAIIEMFTPSLISNQARANPLRRFIEDRETKRIITRVISLSGVGILGSLPLSNSSILPIMGGAVTLMVGVYGTVSLGTRTIRGAFIGSLAAITGSVTSRLMEGGLLNSAFMRQIGIQAGVSFIFVSLASEGARALMEYLYNSRHQQNPRILGLGGLAVSLVAGGAGTLIAYLVGGSTVLSLTTFIGILGGSMMGSGAYFPLIGRIAGDRGHPALPLRVRLPNLHQAINPTNQIINYNGYNTTEVDIPISPSFNMVARLTAELGLLVGRAHRFNLLTFVSPAEFATTADTYERQGAFNDVFGMAVMQPADIIAIHGVGGHVFSPTISSSGGVRDQGANLINRYMHNEDFVEMLYRLSNNGQPFAYLRDATRGPIRLLICFAAQAEFPLSILFSSSTLGQLMATRFRRTVYAGVTVIYPDPRYQYQAFHRFNP